MNSPARTIALVAWLSFAATTVTGASAAPAGSFGQAGASTIVAQLVPRLVDYPVARKACLPDPAASRSEQLVFTFINGRQEETVRVFGDAACGADALLFTLQFDPGNARASVRVLPTANGAASLRQACDAYDWEAGSARTVPSDGCASLRQFFVATGTPQG